MSLVPYTQANERVVGANSASYADVDNRALKFVILTSGLDDTQDFLGFASGSAGAVIPEGNVLGRVGDIYSYRNAVGQHSVYWKETGNNTNSKWRKFSEFNESILPTVDLNNDIGSLALRWNNAFIGGQLTLGPAASLDTTANFQGNGAFVWEQVGTPNYFRVIKQDASSGIENFTTGSAAGFLAYNALERARGTYALPTDVLAGDLVGAIRHFAYINGGYKEIVRVSSEIPSTGTVSSTSYPGRLRFQTTADGTTILASRWQVESTGHFWASTDNTYDIGASGATRPRSAYIGTSVVIGSPGNASVLRVGADNTNGSAFFASHISILGGPTGANLVNIGSTGATHPNGSVNIKGISNVYVTPATATASSINDYIQLRTAASAFTLSTGYGIYIDVPSIGAGSAITTLRGIYINNQGAAGITTSVGIEIGPQSGSATNYALRTSTGLVVFPGGPVLIGPGASLTAGSNFQIGQSSSSPLATTTQRGMFLDFVGNSSSTNLVNGAFFRIQTAAAAYTVTNSYSIFIDTPVIGATSAITTNYGLWIANQTGAGTNFAIVTNQGLVQHGDTMITQLIRPGVTNTYDLGASAFFWNNLYLAVAATFGTSAAQSGFLRYNNNPGAIIVVRDTGGAVDRNILTVSGTANDITIGNTGLVNSVNLSSTAGTWTVNASAHFVPSSNNVFDIGTSTTTARIMYSQGVQAMQWLASRGGGSFNAAAGGVRLSPGIGFGIAFRNNANSADLQGMEVDASNNIVIGGSAVAIKLAVQLLASTDNSYDIGAAGATRFRTAYLGTSVVIATDPGGTGLLRLASTAANQVRIGYDTSNYWQLNITSVGGLEMLPTGTTFNLAIFGAGSYGGGKGVVFLANATTIPSTNPAGGAIIYCEGGAIKARGSSGTVTTLAPA